MPIFDACVTQKMVINSKKIIFGRAKSVMAILHVYCEKKKYYFIPIAISNVLVLHFVIHTIFLVAMD